LLSIEVLFPKQAKRFEGDNAHVGIIQRSRIGNNLRMERRTLPFTCGVPSDRRERPASGETAC
jgi:hypothetical protein